MRFAKINEAIWTDQKFNQVEDDSKLLYIYLLSCSKCNSVGIFDLGLGQMEDEFRHGRDQIKACLKELEEADLARYRDGWIWFNKFLRWNDPSSPNHARRFATDINECAMKGAPKDAVENFLSSARPCLRSLKFKTRDGKERSYYDEFVAALDVALLTDFIGSSEALKKCLDSTSYGLSKPSASEVLPKGLPSTDEVATRAHSRNRIRSRIRTEAEQNVSASCSSNSSEVSLFCSDGSPVAIGAESVRLMRSRFLPDDEDGWQKAVISAQRESLKAQLKTGDADSWFTAYITSHFKGAT